MPSNPNKSVQEYIFQGVNIQDADNAALAVPEIWALVPFIRTRLDDRLADLQNKSIIANTIVPAYADKVEEKDIFDADAEEALEKLAVYIENAFPDKAKILCRDLLLDKEYPQDDQHARDYLQSVLVALAAHDNATYPLPASFTDPITAATNGFIETLDALPDLFENRRTAIQDRNIALEQFIEILSPIRKWLWKMLPEGREDTRLIEYGFDPYNAQPSEPEEPLIPWPGPAEIEGEDLGDGMVELRVTLIEDMVDGFWEGREAPNGPWEVLIQHILFDEGLPVAHRELNVPAGKYEYRFTPVNAELAHGLPSMVIVMVK